MIRDVKRKLALLPASGLFRKSLSETRLKKVEEWVSKGDQNTIGYEKWDPGFLFASRKTVAQLISLERDIALVYTKSDQDEAKKLTNDLDAHFDASTQFEVFAKSRLLKRFGDAVVLDPLQTTRKRPDIAVSLRKNNYILECTALAISDYDQKVNDKWFEGMKAGGDKFMIRPGKFDDNDRRQWASGYECTRVLRGVYSKIAPKLDVTRCQFPIEVPTILLLSLPEGGQFLTGAKWALDQLFANQPVAGMDQSVKPGNPDALFLPWLNDTAQNLCKPKAKGEPDLTWDKFCEDYQEIVRAPRRIGAVLVFTGCKFEFGRMNYYANDQNSLNHEALAQFEGILRHPACWCKS